MRILLASVVALMTLASAASACPAHDHEEVKKPVVIGS